MPVRDPLSVRYDATARQVMLRAARASRGGRGVTVWIASSRAELRHPDAGGRSRHERAFTRAAYYLIFRVPLNRGEPPEWSLKLTWGKDADLRPSSQGRMARPVTARLYPRSQARVRGPRWRDDPSLQSGGLGSGKERFGPLPWEGYRQPCPSGSGAAGLAPGVPPSCGCHSSPGGGTRVITASMSARPTCSV